MRIVVGGESRKAGKTTVVCDIVRMFPDAEWTAVKISSHAHGLAEGEWAIEEEREAADTLDTRRYLQAGARRAYWVRGNWEAALPALRELLAGAPNWIVETTRAAADLEHDLFVLVAANPNEEKKTGETGLARLIRARWKP
jgi:hypothetical protein